MTKLIKHVYETVDIDYGTPIRDIPALVLEWLNKYPQDAVVDEHLTFGIQFDRLETDIEYETRINEEQRRKDRELRMLRELIAKHGVPEDAR